MPIRKLVLVLCGYLLILCPLPAQAQQTIFNVPSAEITPQGRLFLQHESQFRPYQPGRFIGNTEYSAVGIGNHTELNLTMFNLNAPASDNIVMGLGFKAALPLWQQKWPTRELKLTVGELIPISLQGHGVGNWSYGHISGRLPVLKTRLTAGVSTGTKQIFGRNTVGFIGGYEQPLTPKLSLSGDWYSGTHALGLFIPGLSYAFPKDVTLYAGYQIPNNRRCGRQGFVIEISKLF